MEHPSRPTFSLWLALLATPAPAQELLASFREPWLDYARLTAFEDLDGDGVEDVIVAARYADLGGYHTGHVVILSGAGGGVLRELPAPRPGIGWGASVVATGDLDGDGVGDLALGAEWDERDGLPYSGSFTLLSGATGAPIYGIWGEPDWALGSSAALLGDVNGDGAPDLAIGTTHGNTVRVVSGPTGAKLLEVTGDAAAGYAVVGPGDLDGNGIPDLVFSDPGDVSHPWVRWVRAVDGASGALLWQNDLVTGDLAVLDDLDGDGVRELGVTYQYYSVHGAAVLSGATGTQLYVLKDVEASSLTVLPDQDGDGVSELLAWDRYHVNGVEGDLRVHSGATGKKLYAFQLGQVTGLVDLERLGDLDGDGAPDLGLTDTWYTDAPEVRLLRGFGPVGTPTCAESAAPNSTGVRARLDAQGSGVLAGYPLTFRASDLPPGSTAILVASRSLAGPPFAWDKTCLGNPLGQFFGSAGSADSAGTAAIPWDKVHVPIRGGVIVTPGDRWHFQVSYADAVSGALHVTPALTVELL